MKADKERYACKHIRRYYAVKIQTKNSQIITKSPKNTDGKINLKKNAK